MAKSSCSVHKYIKRPFGANEVWACANPRCNHYMPPHLEAMVEGKTSLCNTCGNPFVLNIDSLKESKPRCEDCRFEQIKSGDNVPITDVMRDFLAGKES